MKLPSAFHLTMLVWGPAYTRRFLDLCLPALLSPRNIPTLAEVAPVHLIVYTTAADRETIRRSPVLQGREHQLKLRFVLDDWGGYASKTDAMGVCYNAVFQTASAEDAAVIILAPDTIWSDGTLETVGRAALAGKRAVMQAGIRVREETALPVILERFRPSADGSITVPPRALVRIGLDHMHPYYRSWYWDEHGFGRGPSNVYFHVNTDGVVARCFHLHPLMMYPDRPFKEFISTFDDDLQMFAFSSAETFYIVQDSDEIFHIDLADSAWATQVPTIQDSGSAEYVAEWGLAFANLYHRPLIGLPVRFHASEVDARWEGPLRRSDRVARRVLRRHRWAGRWRRPAELFFGVRREDVWRRAVEAGIGWEALPPPPFWLAALAAAFGLLRARPAARALDAARRRSFLRSLEWLFGTNVAARGLGLDLHAQPQLKRLERAEFPGPAGRLVRWLLDDRTQTLAARLDSDVAFVTRKNQAQWRTAARLADEILSEETRSRPAFDGPRGDRPSAFHLVVMVYGESYVRRFVERGLPALLSPRNIPALASLAPVELTLYTTSADRDLIAAAGVLRGHQHQVRLRFVIRDDWSAPENRPIAMWVCHNVAFRTAARENAAVVLLAPDTIWTDGTLEAVGRAAMSGKRAVMQAGIRVREETALPVILEAFQPAADGSITIPPRALVRIALDHMHPYYRAWYWDAPEFSNAPANVYFRVDDSGLVARCFHLHPLLVFPHEDFKGFHSANTDDDMPMVAIPSADEFHIGQDSDEVFHIDLVGDDWGSVVHTLRDRPRPAYLAEWAISFANLYHRHFLNHPIRFHAGDVDDRWQAALALSERVIRRVRLLLAWRSLQLRARELVWGIRRRDVWEGVKAVGLNWSVMPPAPAWFSGARGLLRQVGLTGVASALDGRRREALRDVLGWLFGALLTSAELELPYHTHRQARRLKKAGQPGWRYRVAQVYRRIQEERAQRVDLATPFRRDLRQRQRRARTAHQADTQAQLPELIDLAVALRAELKSREAASESALGGRRTRTAEDVAVALLAELRARQTSTAGTSAEAGPAEDLADALLAELRARQTSTAGASAEAGPAEDLADALLVELRARGSLRATTEAEERETIDLSVDLLAELRARRARSFYATVVPLGDDKARRRREKRRRRWAKAIQRAGSRLQRGRKRVLRGVRTTVRRVRATPRQLGRTSRQIGRMIARDAPRAGRRARGSIVRLGREVKRGGRRALRASGRAAV
ncbi:MAG: hypothetical protein FJW23_06920, partial [Acidimicrobiia bacterium]|nr:hypothetical protein [Acidimicrobiia bacterium]